MPRSTPAVPPNDALADARPPHPPADAALRNRPIRSYVLRQGRVSAAQERACVNLLPRYGVAFQNGYLAWQAVFGRSGRRVLEIGFGMGETTARIANSHPDTDYLAVEVHTPGVGNLLKLIDLEGLHNLRIVWHDAVAVVEHMIEPDTLDAIHVFFPDPWPKTRHHKRRLIKQAFLEQLARRLKTGGIIHLATDWQPYAEEMLQLLGSKALLRNSTDGFAARPETRPMTKFEQRGRKLGHLVFDLIFARTATGCKAPGGALAATGGALRGDQLT